jgi:TPP-dependent pyruvate/acetoin dehydrogenase alpha subunit
MRLPGLPRRSADLPPDLDVAAGYRMMVRMRLVEEALTQAWADGLVPGEYHSGIGEEGINAGVLQHLGPDDSLHLDHRNTPGFIGRGADAGSLMREVLGSESGLNDGRAGHMHLLAPHLRTACDGLVGASFPLAAGSAVAGSMLRPGSVAVAFAGEAAINQGMLMEAWNLAAAWRCPVLFVIKDNRWSITTYSPAVTAGTAADRARSFGMPVASVDGSRIAEVHSAAGALLTGIRDGGGPAVLVASCHRPGGHFEGDGLVRLLHRPHQMTAAWAPGLAKGITGSSSAGAKAGGTGEIAARAARAARDWSAGTMKDPLAVARRLLPGDEAARIERQERAEILDAIEAARAAVRGRQRFGGEGAG